MENKTINLELEKFDEYPVIVNQLELVLTQKCNLNCPHCMRGCASDKSMSEEVLDAIFKKVRVAKSLCLGGGDVSLEPELIRKVIASMKKNKAIAHVVAFPTNGIVLNDEIIGALKDFERYIYDSTGGELSPYFGKSPVTIEISIDDFHLEQMKKQNIDFDVVRKNIRRYAQEFGSNGVTFFTSTDFHLINEGKAKTLETEINKADLNTNYEYPFATTYSPELNKGLAFLGGILTVSTDGEIIPTACSYKNEKLYSAGNIKHDKLSTILGRVNAKQYSPEEIEDAYQNLIYSLAAPEELRDAFTGGEKYLKKREMFCDIKLFGHETKGSGLNSLFNRG